MRQAVLFCFGGFFAFSGGGGLARTGPARLLFYGRRGCSVGEFEERQIRPLNRRIRRNTKNYSYTFVLAKKYGSTVVREFFSTSKKGECTIPVVCRNVCWVKPRATTHCLRVVPEGKGKLSALIETSRFISLCVVQTLFNFKALPQE